MPVLAVTYVDTLARFLLFGLLSFLLELAWPQRKAALPLPGGARWQVSAPSLAVGLAATVFEGFLFLAGRRAFSLLDLGACWAGAVALGWFAQFWGGERRRYPSFPTFVRGAWRDLMIFTRKVCLALIFPITIFVALAVTRFLPFPLLGLHRYDFLLALFLATQVLLLMLKLESPAELKTITLFHLLGLTMELFKVQAGSWAYPEPALTKVLGVPLYSGFMYASVASFLIQIWHRLDLRLERWPHHLTVAVLGAAIYLNFFTHHFVADLRWFLILGVLFVFFRSRVVVINTVKPRSMPLVAGFLGFGFFIWIAENLGTLLGGWVYPNQREGWELVHVSKINAWFLLGIISFILVAQLKRREQRTDTSHRCPTGSPQEAGK